MKPFEHFGLSLPPFETAPDPRLYVPTTTHEEALATLRYAVVARKSCCVLLGESGTGKTLLARIVADGLTNRGAVLWADDLALTGGAAFVWRSCGADAPRGSVGAGPDRTALDAWLGSAGRGGGPALLIVDQADRLAPDAWARLERLLARDGLRDAPLTTFLIGLPALRGLLDGPALVRLARRVFRICHLAPLDRAQTAEYVVRRLSTAGAGTRRLITPDAVRLVADLSGGIPALINQLCENALLSACAAGRSLITSDDVRASQAVTVCGAAAPDLPAARGPDDPLAPGAALKALRDRVDRAVRAVRQVRAVAAGEPCVPTATPVEP